MTLSEAFLEQKVALGEKLYQLTSKILQQARKKQFIGLEMLMEEREEIIKEIQYLDQVYQDKCDLKEISTATEKAYIIKLREFFSKVQMMDIELTKIIQGEMEAGVNELQQIKNAQKINQAYNSYPAQGSLLDKQR